MKKFNYTKLKNKTWDTKIINYLTRIHEVKGKQQLFLKQNPEELEKLVIIAKIQSTESSNEIEGIRTTNTRLKQLVSEKTAPKNRAEEEIAGYRDAQTLYMKILIRYLLPLILFFNYIKYCYLIHQLHMVGNIRMSKIILVQLMKMENLIHYSLHYHHLRRQPQCKNYAMNTIGLLVKE